MCWFRPALTWMKSSGRNSSSIFHAGSVKGQLRLVRPQRVHRIDAAGLQEDREIVRLREVFQRLRIARRQRLQVAEDERDRVVACDEFDLRNVATAVHAIDQRESAAIFIPICGITVWHSCRSATKRGSCSRKPTSVLSFFSTRRTEKRPLRR
jgi:hypothetical protein